MRAALLAIGLAAAAAGCTRACKDGTLLVTVDFGGAASSGDAIAVDVTVGTGAAMHTSIAGPGGASSGTIEVDFASYPSGSQVTVKVTVTRGGQLLGSASGQTTLGEGCGTLAISLAGGDLGAPDLRGADLKGADLAMSDAARPSDLGGADLSPVCGNGVLDHAEACDDGNNTAGDGCDATCAIEVGAHSDFDVAADRSLVAIRADTGSVSAKCWDPNGRVRADWFKVYSGLMSSVEAGREQVVVSRGGISLITWVQQATPGDFNTRLPTSVVLDAACGVTTPVVWPIPPSGNYVYDTAMDKQADYALLFQVPGASEADVVLGSLTGMTKLVVDTAGNCTGNYALHVAFNEATAAGVVTCQQHQAMPIRFRRFTLGFAWADPQMVTIADTMGGNSSWYESHQVAMNDVGDFVVEWQNAGTMSWEADLFDPNGTVVKQLSLAAITGMVYDGFRYPHQRAAVDQGTNFILRSNDAPGMFWRESPVGMQLGAAPPGSFSKLHLRTGGTADHWLDDATRIARNPLTL